MLAINSQDRTTDTLFFGRSRFFSDLPLFEDDPTEF